MYERIRNLREDRDLTQTDVANFLKMSQRGYSSYECGKRSIPINILKQLADFHGTSVDYLIESTDVKEPYPRKKNKK